MNILLVHYRIPYPLNNGRDKISFNLIRILAGRHTVTLLAPLDELTPSANVEQVRKLGCQVIAVPVMNRIKEISRSRMLYLQRLWMLAINRLPTYVFNDYYPELAAGVAECCASGEYEIAQALCQSSGVYLEHDFPHILRILGPIDDMVEAARTDMQVASTGRKKLIYKLEYRARMRYQPATCKKFDAVFFLSPQDQHRLEQLAGGLSNAFILPTAVENGDSVEQADLDYDEPEPDSVVFVGGLGSLFNQDAVHYFYREILPLIRAKVPGIRFYIVGQHPPPSILKLARDRQVIVTGAVEDVKPYIRNTAVSIAPVRAGTGFKTKIVEALRLGKPVVSTTMGVSGLWDVDLSAISITDQPEAFADEVIRLLIDPAARKKMGHNAYELYRRAYSFTAVRPKTLKVYEELISRFSTGAQAGVRD